MNPLEVLQTRKSSLDTLAGPYSLRHHGEGVCSLHSKMSVVESEAIDKKRMVVPCTITTQDEDRERDIVVTAGIDLTHHKNNPVVLLDHGFTRSGKYPSVARADDENGVYQVSLEPGKARSVSRFSSKIADSYETYALIEEGLLPAVSIGFRAIDLEYRRDRPDDYRGYPGLLITRSELVEYSHCPIGVNPYALADRISRGIEGKSFCEFVMKSLSHRLPVLREMVKGGFDTSTQNTHSTGEKMSTETATKEKEVQDETVKKAEVTKAEGMNETTGSDGGYVKPDERDETPDSKKKGEDSPQEESPQDDPTKDWLPGAKVLAGCYGLLSGVGQFITAGYTQQENETVKGCLDSLATGVEEHCSTVDGVFSECYPDYQKLWEESDESSEGERDDGADGAEGAEGDEDETEKSDESDSEDEGSEDKKHMRLTPAGKALVARLKKLDRIARAKANAGVLGSEGKAKASEAAQVLVELAGLSTPLTASQKTAAKALAQSLKTASQGVSTPSEVRVKELEEKCAKLESALAKTVGQLTELQKAIKKKLKR